MKLCKNCMLPELHPEALLDNTRLCSFCRKERFYGILSNPLIRDKIAHKHKLLTDFTQTIRNCKGKAEYDCLVPLSGGKDSTYLAYLLQEHYNVRVLGFSVDTGFLSPLAKPNIKRVVSKLGIDHVFITLPSSFMKKLYRYLLLHPILEKQEYAEKGYVTSVCRFCTEVIHSAALHEAVKRGISLVTLGYSPDQIEHYFYEIPQQDINQKSWIPEFLHHEPFQEKDRAFFWDPKRYNPWESFPRVLFPFHVIKYPGTETIQKILADLDLISQRKSNPLVTNCQINSLLVYLDIKTFGYNSYVSGVCHQIREGLEKRTKMVWILGVWRIVVQTGLYRNLIAKKQIDYVLGHLEILLDEIKQH